MRAERRPDMHRRPPTRGASTHLPLRDRQQRQALLGRIFIALLGIGLTVLAGYGIRDAYRKVNSQKIATVQIEGAMNYVREDEIKAAVGRFVSASLVALDLDLLKQELENQPWISEVEVRRAWPDKLIIRVEEEQPIARWGEDKLLNIEGQVFAPENIVEQLQLPKLSGPEHSEEEVMLQYLQFNQLLYPLGVRIRDLVYNERGAWTMTLTNGIEVRLGRDVVLERLRRLVVFLESEYGRDMGAIQSIDLRYTNGVAVVHRDANDTTGTAEEVVAL